ncbi:MAG: hypothetical protein H7141_10955 [Burkholderiales bacterium]|nr:hypothetical protein [Bacteroidia bacterium]
MITLCCFSQVIIGIRIYSVFKTKFETGKEVLNEMHQKYKNRPCRSYTFSQKNMHYRNYSIIGKSEWHGAIELPDKFRINFGAPEDENIVIFKNDSSYRYKNNQFNKKT